MNKSRISNLLFYLTLLFLPTQLGKHFWPSFSYIFGARVDYLSPTIYLTDILIFALFIFWVLSFVKNQKSKIKNQKYNLKFKIILPLIFFLGVGILFSKNPMAGWYGMIKFLEFLFFGYFVSKIATMKNLGIIIAIFVIGVFFESALAIFQYLSQSSIGGFFYFLGERTFNAQTPSIANASINGQLMLRPYGTFSHPNVLAGYLTISMLMVISNVQYQMSNIKRSFFIAAVVIGSIGLFLTMSRAAISLWLLVIGYYFFNYLKTAIPNKKIIGLLVVLVFIGSIGIYFQSPIGSRFSNFNFSDESFIQRRDLISASFLMVKENLFFGVGLNNFLPNLPLFYKTQAGSFFTYLQPVHNIYLLIATQTGLAGLGVFAWFILKILGNVKCQMSNVKCQMLAIVLVFGFFDHYFLTLQQGQLLFSFVLGLCFSNIDGIIKKRIK